MSKYATEIKEERKEEDLKGGLNVYFSSEQRQLIDPIAEELGFKTPNQFCQFAAEWFAAEYKKDPDSLNLGWQTKPQVRHDK